MEKMEASQQEALALDGEYKSKESKEALYKVVCEVFDDDTVDQVLKPFIDVCVRCDSGDFDAGVMEKNNKLASQCLRHLSLLMTVFFAAEPILRGECQGPLGGWLGRLCDLQARREG